MIGFYHGSNLTLEFVKGQTNKPGFYADTTGKVFVQIDGEAYLIGTASQAELETLKSTVQALSETHAGDVKTLTEAIAALAKKVDDNETDIEGKVTAINTLLENTYATKAYADAAANAKDTAIAAAKSAADQAQADVDALEDFVGDALPEGTKATTVIGFIEERTENIASDSALTAAVGRIAALEGKVDVEKVSSAIEVEKLRAEGAESALDGRLNVIESDYLKKADKDELAEDISDLADRVTDTETAIGVLNGTGEGSVKKSIDDAFNDFSTKVSDDKVVNSYKELIDYAAEHGAEFTALVGDVTDNTNAIATLNGNAETAGSVAKSIKDAIDAENLGQYETKTVVSGINTRLGTAEGEIDTLQTDLDTAEGKIATLEGLLGEGGNVDQRIKTAIDALNIDQYATDSDLAGEVSRAQAAEQANATAAANAQTAADNAQKEVDALELIVDTKATTAALNQAKTDLEKAISDLTNSLGTAAYKDVEYFTNYTDTQIDTALSWKAVN